ncbi:MAG: four helix bundle protein [Terriglobia bacterium]
MAIERFEQLEVWQVAHHLVLDVYKVTQELPKDQRFGLVSQMQRAGVSVPANIAEGFKRRGPADKVRFYNIAQGSLEELRYYFILCRDLGYKVEFELLADQTERVGRMLTGLIRSVGGRP